MIKSVIKLVLVTILFTGGIALNGCLESDEPYDALKQLEKDQAAIDEYIASQGYTDVKTDSVENQLRYVMVSEGNGDSPAGGDWVFLNYKGSLMNGTVFDENDSVYVKLTQLIPGWQILLPYGREGGRMIMLIPSLYAYRNAGNNSVPPNSPLAFDVTIHEVLSQFEYEQRRLTSYAADYIANYEGENELILETDSVEGLHYIILDEGNGTNPTLTDNLNVEYEGKFVNGDIFTEATGAQLVLQDLIKGWRVLLPYASEGGTIVMFIPSEFGYGPGGSRSIPGDTPLVFTVTLNSITQ